MKPIFIKIEKKESRTQKTLLWIASGTDGKDYSRDIPFLTKRTALKKQVWIKPIPHTKDISIMRFHVTDIPLSVINPNELF